ncbi:hypothetical protein AAX26_01159 [Aliarcobacter thereius]|uniref:Uncharacterized protein n=1 Tax=Aliarcobacter thereius TaxID=544718 RepID=A0A5R9H4M6_9BACT|nr:hypothetical protein [Aliarcobacter thereius]OCL86853.1 hypothetical protein AAX26_01159 [Aliarcobacter thereius]TLS72142.1 hypothetical protein FE246_06865 [Aliarcobacter thereius]
MSTDIKNPITDKNLKNKNDVSISEFGNYVYGTLDGVDFGASGKLENGNPYPAKVILRFIFKINEKKTSGAVEIITSRSVVNNFRITTTDGELPNLVSKYNELVGKTMLIKYVLGDGQNVVINPDNLTILN